MLAPMQWPGGLETCQGAECLPLSESGFLHLHSANWHLHICVCMSVRSVVSDSWRPPMDGSPPVIRQEHWSGFPFPLPGDLPDPRIEPASLASPALAGGLFTALPPEKPRMASARSSRVLGRELFVSQHYIRFPHALLFKFYSKQRDNTYFSLDIRVPALCPTTSPPPPGKYLRKWS